MDFKHDHVLSKYVFVVFKCFYYISFHLARATYIISLLCKYSHPKDKDYRALIK